jgi:hypothetical protein
VLVDPKASAYADMATILANTRGLTALCHLLAVRGLITEAEFERVRHYHLHEFDNLFQSVELPPSYAAALDERRAAIEAFWEA